MKKIYNSKWFPRLFSVRSDGGKDSGVTAYFLIEWKPVISIGLLHFKPGTREAYHSHAFNALTWWLQGSVTEVKLIEPVREFGDVVSYKENEEKDYNHSTQRISRKSMERKNCTILSKIIGWAHSR
jgi:diphthamide synthase (EF-2-diphthine--ammonia ligase)